MFDNVRTTNRKRRQERVRTRVRGTDAKPRLSVFRKLDAAKKVGALVAKKCLEQSISQVIFDRNGFLYHGRVRALADAAREAGLKL